MYLKDENKLWIAHGQERLCMIPKMASRHGLIAGATGTGKTVTLRVLAESFSDMGVPVFLADIKGDVSGMCKAGEPNGHVSERIAELGVEDFSYSAYPVRFFDVFGKKGIPVRATVSDMGPGLLARIMNLNETQSGILNIIFKIAADNGLPLLDMKDLRAMLQYAGEHRNEFQTKYGNISTQSIGAMQRAMLSIENSGGDIFFGEPQLDLGDWMSTDENGRGYINLLNCVELVQNPMLYSTFLLWMLSELYEMLPEAGDLEKPKIIFFFDEAHLLFNDAPKPLLQKVEQMARLIRSKGVGIYFITQSPTDIPDSVLSQLGNKIQHALRAYTPKDKKAVKAAAESFRENPAFDSEQVIGELGTGEALISLLDENGIPCVVDRAFILPPRSFLGVAEDKLVDKLIQNCPLHAKYGQAFDRESAYEILHKNAQAKAQEELDAKNAKAQAELDAKNAKVQKELDVKNAKEQSEKEKLKEKEQLKKQKEEEKLEKEREKLKKEREKLEKDKAKKTSSKKKSSLDKALDATMTTVGRELGKNILKGLMGTKKK